jgi:hypothetical protein
MSITWSRINGVYVPSRYDSVHYEYWGSSKVETLATSISLHTQAVNEPIDPGVFEPDSLLAGLSPGDTIYDRRSEVRRKYDPGQ